MDYQLRDGGRRIEQMVAVGRACGESREIAGAQLVLPVLVAQCYRAGEDVDELVLALVPVGSRACRAGLQRKVIDPELGQPHRLPELPLRGALAERDLD